ncbi:glycosyltransferase family 25 protein [Cyanobium gracile]|uniref:Glycosyltransferase family 25 protein n=1 Tax=Cyanobium gracile UHCC 0281 TaxID=3110309 RepID=A0ABU5SXN3_9CYAN|nr:glycosyltransferase family 25 protein [Cyanobium gracile]MEA5443273.1 glycosyltransferase family 25 protein [Cyanobium gracile UHCC 0281]
MSSSVSMHGQGLVDYDYHRLKAVKEAVSESSYLYHEVCRTIEFLHDLQKTRDDVPNGQLSDQSAFHLDSSGFPVFYFLNLKSREDRRKLIQRIAAKLSINPAFISAIHGASSDLAKSIYEDNKEYAKTLVANVPEHGIQYSISAYKDYGSVPSRERYFYEKWNQKLLSLGSIGYLLSYRKALIDASVNQRLSVSDFIVICDDDVRPHTDFWAIWQEAWKQVSGLDPMIISLGAMQYFWNEKDISWISNNIYRCNGTSIASHATMIHKTLVPEFVQLIDDSTLPLDIGALHYLKRKYASQTFVVFPNLFIQDVSESDIADTANQSNEGVKEDNIFRWKLSDYCFNI